MRPVIGAVILALGVMQAAVAAVGFARALRDAHYDAIAAGTNFDGRWFVASLLASVGATLVWRWPWQTALVLTVVGYLLILPVREGLRRLFARRSRS